MHLCLLRAQVELLHNAIAEWLHILPFVTPRCCRLHYADFCAISQVEDSIQDQLMAPPFNLQTPHSLFKNSGFGRMANYPNDGVCRQFMLVGKPALAAGISNGTIEYNPSLREPKSASAIVFCHCKSLCQFQISKGEWYPGRGYWKCPDGKCKKFEWAHKKSA